MIRILILISVLLGASTGHATDLDVVLSVGASDPSLLANNPVAQNEIAVTKAVLDATTITWALKFTQPMRFFEEIENSPKVCANSVTAQSAHERNLIWIPLFESGVVLVAGPDFEGRISRLEETQTYRVGAAVRSRAQVMLTDAGVKPDLIYKDALNYQKLRSGRIDLWLTTRETPLILDRASGLSPLKIIYRGEMLEIGFACNPALDPRILGELTQAAKQFMLEHGGDWMTLK